MDNFVAIDFETANREPSSVCSVGIVVVREGKIQNHLYRLIHPTPNYYNYWNTRVHGLTAADTAQAPAFPFVWAEIEPLIGGLPLVAHNAVFDEGCLKAVFRKYGMTYPEYKFYCTCRASRRVFGKRITEPSTTNRCCLLWISSGTPSSCPRRCRSLCLDCLTNYRFVS